MADPKKREIRRLTKKLKKKTAELKEERQKATKTHLAAQEQDLWRFGWVLIAILFVGIILAAASKGGRH